jgi:hypothetical protein
LISRECHSQPLLDIGIGARRTIPVMMHISSDYIGIDYTASLLEQSRALSRRRPSTYGCTQHVSAAVRSRCADDVQLERHRLRGL